LPKVSNQELEGITLKVYLFVVKKNSPVGTREVTRGLNLSSPSVAYRHLEKLEESGLLQKNEFEEYIVKRKADVHGYTWIGKHLMPKMLLYSTVFLGILIVELIVFALHFAVETYEFKVFFLLLILVTVFAMAVFIVEGLRQRRRTKRETETP
jgi:repressor of nif and glnA expression